MQACDETILSAYLDDELDPLIRERVALHLRDCAHCAAEFEAIREASEFARQHRFADITAPELSRLHAVLDEQPYAAPWRLYAAIGAVAASVLVSSATWLAAIPADRHIAARPVSPPAEWERVAMNLNLDPLSTNDHEVHMADARTADWMIEALNGSK